ncbi:MAG: phosphohistidine phosphatase SixA [Spirochaetota bacterium]|nr:MAG: phosphohistidine phosphatase SixA [Spirochaetota bacterium]
MYLYLVQHADAKQKEEDPDRHLTASGKEVIQRVASFLAENIDIQLHSIIHSGKTRAIETAKVLSGKLKPLKGIEEGKELGPNSTPWGWVENLSQIENNIMLVGHLPHLQRLSSLLLCQDEHKKVIEFQNGGVLCLFKDESSIWTTKWLLIPQIIPQQPTTS